MGVSDAIRYKLKLKDRLFLSVCWVSRYKIVRKLVVWKKEKESRKNWME